MEKMRVDLFNGLLVFERNCEVRKTIQVSENEELSPGTQSFPGFKIFRDSGYTNRMFMKLAKFLMFRVMSKEAELDIEATRLSMEWRNKVNPLREWIRDTSKMIDNGGDTDVDLDSLRRQRVETEVGDCDVKGCVAMFYSVSCRNVHWWATVCDNVITECVRV